MASKRFCDIQGCGAEVTDYPVSGFVRHGQIDLKVTIELATEAENLDLCHSCFWQIVVGLDKRQPLLTEVVALKKKPRRASRHAV